MSDVMGFKKHPGTPGVYVSEWITIYLADKEVLSKKPFTVGLADCHATRQSSGRGSGANEGQIYVNPGRKLSCFPSVDGCAATFILSHNVGLNRAAITSFSHRKLRLCKVYAPC